MRIFLILLIFASNTFVFAQTEKRIHIKNTIQKFYSEKEKDTVSEFFITEEFDSEGNLSMKVNFINGNFGDITTYHYRDTFLFKKIITHNEYTEYDTITYEDSIIKEVRIDINPFFKDSMGVDKNGKIQNAQKKLMNGNKIIITTHYETRYDAHLTHNYTTKKDEMKRSFYQLVHEYFIEYDSLGRKVAEYSAIDKWEYDKVKIKKFEYDQNGNLTKILLANEDGWLDGIFDLEKSILNLYSDSIFSLKDLREKNTDKYSDIVVYSSTGVKIQESSYYMGYSSKLQSATLYLYDEKNRLDVEQCISGDTQTEKTYYFLNKNSFKVSKSVTRSQYKNQPVELESENFKYNSNNHLLIEQFKEKNGSKSDWFTYEYTFH